jgi:hypothetical protein
MFGYRTNTRRSMSCMRPFVAAVLLAYGATAAAVSGCASIEGEPVNEQVSFEADIQPRIDVTCSDCHTTSSEGGLNLRFDNVLNELLGPGETGVPSEGYPGYFRLRPGLPMQSLFFLRVNCENAGNPPVVIGTMPPFGGAPTDLMALIHDWIATGAIMANGDRLFIGTFETIRVATP